MKVYIATTGSYSDYRIAKVFLREEDAREYCGPEDRWNENDYDEYEVHEGPVEKRAWWQVMWQTEPKRIDDPYVFSNVKDYNPDRKLAHSWQGNRLSGETHAVLRIEGWSKEDVMKVYSEQRAQFLADKEGIS